MVDVQHVEVSRSNTLFVNAAYAPPIRQEGQKAHDIGTLLYSVGEDIRTWPPTGTLDVSVSGEDFTPDEMHGLRKGFEAIANRSHVLLNYRHV